MHQIDRGVVADPQHAGGADHEEVRRRRAPRPDVQVRVIRRIDEATGQLRADVALAVGLLQHTVHDARELFDLLDAQLQLPVGQAAVEAPRPSFQSPDNSANNSSGE
jgi:hypothetical protein